jgi:hypothetical protein
MFQRRADLKARLFFSSGDNPCACARWSCLTIKNGELKLNCNLLQSTANNLNAPGAACAKASHARLV